MRTRLSPNQADSSLATDLEVITAITAHKADQEAHPVYAKGDNVVNSVNNRKGPITLTKSDVGLSNVDNIADFDKPLSAAAINALSAKVNTSLVGANNGIATLDGTGKVPASQLPSFVDDVIEAANFASFPGSGETSKIYIALDTNKTYRWSGSVYVYITSGAVESVAGKVGIVTLVKADVGLNNVDNTSDVNKPVSTAQQSAINAAQAAAIAASAPVAHVGAGGSSHASVTTTVNGFMSSVDKVKLDAITGSNSGDETGTTIRAKLGISTLSGSNTGDQTTITGNAGTATKLATARNINGVAFDGSADITVSAVDTATPRVASSLLGANNGVATLDGGGKVPSSQLPSFVDDVIESASLAALPAVGETGKIYITLDNNKTYRWSGSVYVYITSGAVDSVAGKTGVVTLVKADVGLSNVDNTSDANKPVSSATLTALNAKIPWSSSGAPNGVATLDASSKILESQLPIRNLLVAMAALSGTSTIDLDNTTPLISEGTQIATATLGPAEASSKLLISGDLSVDCGTNNRNMIVACFRGSVCIGALPMSFISAGRGQAFPFSFTDPNFGTVGVGSTAVYSLRFGVATGATWYVNRQATVVLNGMMNLNRMARFEELN